MRTETLGGLRVRITGGDDREGSGTGPVVVLMHGYGAPGDDLVTLARVIDAPHGTRFVFPEAPQSIPGFPAGRAWWQIDPTRIERLARGNPADMSREVPDGLTEARAEVDAMLDEIARTMHPSKLVLGGFSQGAMLSADVVLRGERAFAGLVMLSGTFLASGEWTPLMARRQSVPVYMSHGTADAMLPYPLAERLRDALTTAGLSVTWTSFRGGHEIPHSVIEGVGKFLRAAFG